MKTLNIEKSEDIKEILTSLFLKRIEGLFRSVFEKHSIEYSLRVTTGGNVEACICGIDFLFEQLDVWEEGKLRMYIKGQRLLFTDAEFETIVMAFVMGS